MGTAWWLPSIICATVAAFRTRGALSFLLASSAALDCLFWWLRNLGDQQPTWYSLLWPFAALWMTACRGTVALTLSRPTWPVYGAAIAVHAVALVVSPDRWPGTWLQAEEHAVALVALMCGLSMVAAGKTRRHVAVAALFLGTAAAYYCVPGNPQVRVWLMWWQCACYLAMAA